jgi:hypothetical protein
MQKMTLADLKALYSTYEPYRYKSPDGLQDKTSRTNWGSKRQARHTHNPVWLPAVGGISPSVYRHLRVAKTATTPVITSPSINLIPTQETKIVYIRAASLSGKQNDPAYRKRFGSCAK